MRNLRVGNAFRERIQTVRPVGAADAVRQARRKARREPRIPRPERDTMIADLDRAGLGERSRRAADSVSPSRNLA